MPIRTITEEWRDVVGYGGRYQVSNVGRVRTLERKYGRNKTVEPGLRKCQVNFGYSVVMLRRDGDFRSRRVHRLVLEAFVGPCPDGHETRHLNGHKLDNRVKNLAWGTRSENARDKIRHGTSLKGRRSWVSWENAILTEDDVREIRSLDGTTISTAELGSRYGVSGMTIANVIARRAWQRVE